jgi:hypothetical protein
MEKATNLPEGPEKFMAIVMIFAIGIGSLCGMVYPILLWIFMNRAPVVNFMQSRVS